MATLHVRNVPDALYERLRRQAKADGRSLSAEVITLLGEISGREPPDSAAASATDRRRNARAAEPADSRLLRETQTAYRLQHELDISADLLERAMAIAEARGLSLGTLLTDYLRRLESDAAPADAPIVSRLLGSLPADVSPSDYRHYLDEKYDDAPTGHV